MFKVDQILVTAIVLAASAVVLNGCGQKGPLVLPSSRATTPAPKPAPPSVNSGTSPPVAMPSQ
ncbi:MAG: lipoprotein [Comamonadaceae bacterium]|uniref:LPS translocon maturation chaperone LptM n=1 Tax=Candidatus Skiveiella danica TaxID=3386177 RepID=UPI00390BFBA4|nr:lipoprotein [Comamonadaceae bacterium]